MFFRKREQESENGLGLSQGQNPGEPLPGPFPQRPCAPAELRGGLSARISKEGKKPNRHPASYSPEVSSR